MANLIAIMQLLPLKAQLEIHSLKMLVEGYKLCNLNFRFLVTLSYIVPLVISVRSL